MSTPRWLDDLRQDVRYTVRGLGRSPGFAAVAIVTLAIGIGANTAIFSVVNAVILRPLPYRDPGSLVLIAPEPTILSPDWAMSAWRERASSLSDFAGFNGPRPGTLIVGDNPEQIDSADVTWNFFSFLGVAPSVGRDFIKADGTPGLPAVAMLTHDFWVRRFNGDRGIVGATITLDRESLTVIGVASPAFRFPTGGALPASGLPIDTQPDVLRVAVANRPLNVIGRLAPGATTSSASPQLLEIYKQGAAGRFTQTFLNRAHVGVAPLQQRLVGDVRQRLWIVMGAVGLLLLVACANVANLLLARASTRQRELAVRMALGARRGRLARLLLSETILLALIGSGGALFFTYWMRGIARTILADQIPHVESISLDWWVLGFNIAVAAATGILCGLASLPGAMNVNLAAILSAGNAPGFTGRTTARRLLLATEVAVTFVLVVSAALLTQTLWNLQRKDRGFDSDRMLTVRVSPGLPPGIDRSRLSASQSYFAGFFADLTSRIDQLPGVGSVAAVSSAPFDGLSVGLRLAVAGHDPPMLDETSLNTMVSSVTPGYFRTMGTRLVAGRPFQEADALGSPLVAVVNEAFARRFAPSQEIIGSRLTYDKRMLTVVGLVEDAPDRSLRVAAQPLLFTPLAQMAAHSFGFGRLTLVVRTENRDPRSLAPAVRREIWSIDGNIVVDELASMNDRVAASMRSERQGAWLFGLFAMTALLIATIGVYGVAMYAMTQRTREIGIRVALGAARRDVVRLVVSQTLSPTLFGIAIGLAGAFATTRVLGARLDGVTALDPGSFLAAALLLVSVAFAASYLPARKAMQIDPVRALRAE